jgi:hypothetical protein
MESGIVRHLLLARIREGTPPEALQAAMAGFRDIARKVEGVLAFEHGANNSPEGANRGFNYVVSLTFANPRARDAYLPHAEHIKLVHQIGALGMVEDMLAFDYTPLD